jgi:hypothetical protein
MSDPGRHAALFDGLPRDTGALAKTVQGLLIHQHIAPAYGVTLSRDQQAQSHVRAVEKILDDIVTRDGRPLSVVRATNERQVGVCRHFTLLHVAMLRTQGVPARARCGFGSYFEKGKYLDHWVTEYWNKGKERWALFDAQIDDRQRELFRIGFDTADVPRDQFVVAGDAWSLCRGARAARALVHCGQPRPRRRRVEQPRDAAVGRLGRNAPAGQRAGSRLFRSAGNCQPRA